MFFSSTRSTVGTMRRKTVLLLLSLWQSVCVVMNAKTSAQSMLEELWWCWVPTALGIYLAAVNSDILPTTTSSHCFVGFKGLYRRRGKILALPSGSFSVLPTLGYTLIVLYSSKIWYLPLHVTVEYFTFSNVHSVPGHCQLQFIQIFLRLLTVTFTGWQK